mmetsp:Transcript_107161/g.313379  ORF Transcript_107161/g.313379 Transcript_107161/m.313379 type:complete len:483 (-) Transcript_107161:46-1494(-)
MGNRAVHAGLWACISGGLLLCHFLKFLQQPAFTGSRVNVAFPRAKLSGRAAGVSLNRGQPPRSRQSVSCWALGLTGLGLSWAAVSVRLTTAGHASQRRWQSLRRARGKSHDSDNSDSKAAGGTGAETPEATPNALVEELEAKMHRLAGAGKYADAAAVRDELSNAQVDDEARVLLANTELYEAFSSRDLERMKALWLQDPYVQCIHPYEKQTIGYTDVCNSWQRLFAVASSFKSVIAAENVRVVVRGATATVFCTEQVELKKRKSSLISMLATNIFRKVNGKWYLVHRHESVANEGFGGAPSLNDQPTARDFAEASDASRQLAQMAQVVSPFARIIIKGAGDRGFGDGEADVDMDEDCDMELDDDDDFDDELVEEDVTVMDTARDTVRALRRLSMQGLLTPMAKIQLMSEMLRNPGESMPERAHELLLTEVPEDEREAAWDDFAALVAMEAKRIDARKAKASDGNERRRGQSSRRGKGRGLE